MIVTAFIITLLYCFIISAFIIGFNLVKEFNSLTKNITHSFSVIIPFRNEEKALPALLKSIQNLNFPKDKYEVIFVNDASTDRSVDLITNFFAETHHNSTVIDTIRSSNSPKKDAISTAIRQARFDRIITTDADCILPKNWLKVFDAFIQQNNPALIVAPVTYNLSTKLLNRFQLLDILSLQGATIGGFGIKKPFLCNGANLCYTKKMFELVNGFEGNAAIASGDDIFMLEKVLKKASSKVMLLKSKEAVVYSQPQPNFKELLQQRIRWAAKSTSYKNRFSKLVALSVLSMNALLIILLLIGLLGYLDWFYVLLFFGFKFLADLFLLIRTASFFKQRKVLASYPWSSLLYPFFSMFVITTSLTSDYQWKGRRFKQ